MLQMRATTPGIADNCVEILGRNQIDLPPRQALRQFPFTVVRLQRATARLIAGCKNLTTIPRQNLCRITVDVAKDQILCTAGQQGYAEAPSPRCRQNPWN